MRTPCPRPSSRAGSVPVVVGVLATLALAGCTGAQPSTTPGPGGPSGSTPAGTTPAVSPPRPATPAVPQGTAPAPAPTGSAAAPTVTGAAAVPTTAGAASPGPVGGASRCATAALGVTVGGPAGAAAGTSSRFVLLTNRGSTPCALVGFPGVSVVAADGTQVGRSAVREGPAERVVLAPGAVAHAKLFTGNWQNYDPALCVPTPVAGLRVYPPGETVPAFVPERGTGCADVQVTLLRVDTVRPGLPASPAAP